MLGTLLKKQLLEINSFYFQNKKTGKRRSLGGILLMIALFLFVFASIGFTFAGIAHLFADTLVALGLDWVYFAFMGLMALALGVIGSVFSTYSSLYHAKDNEMLLSMPIKPSVILFARMAGVYLMGLLYEALVLVPAMIVYWIVASPSVLSIVFSVILVFVIGLLVLALTCLLGWVVALIASRLKNKSAVTVILSLAFIFLYYFVYFKAVDIIQSLLQNIDKASETVKSWIYPMYKFGLAATGDILSMLIFVLICGALFAIVYYVLAKSFTRITTMSGGSVKRKNKVEYKSTDVKKALVKRELKHFLASPTYMLNCGLGVIFMVLASVVLIIKADVIGSLNIILKGVFGDMVTPAGVGVAATAVIMMLIGTAPYTAPSVSIEGKNMWQIQVLPVRPQDALMAKLRMHLYLNTVPALIVTVIAAFVFHTGWTVLTMMLAVVAFVYLSGIAGLAINIKFPNLTWTNEAVPVKQGVSVVIVLFGSWILAMAIGAGYFFAMPYIDANVFLLLISFIFVVADAFITKWVNTRGAEIFAKL